MTPSTSCAISSPNSARSVVEVGVRVLDDVVQERRRERLLVEVELGADLRDRPRVVDERLARAPDLPLVRGGGEAERARQQLLVDARVVRLDGRDQLVDEVLVMPIGVDDSHRPSVLRAPEGESPPAGVAVWTENPCRP